MAALSSLASERRGKREILNQNPLNFNTFLKFIKISLDREMTFKVAEYSASFIFLKFYSQYINILQRNNFLFYKIKMSRVVAEGLAVKQVGQETFLATPMW